MSRLITTRYEYAQYDDAQGVLTPAKDVPPTYPPTLDTYRVNTVASVAQSFGCATINSPTGATQNVSFPQGATLTLFFPLTNTTIVNVSSLNATPSLGAGVANLSFIGAPGQTVTIPGNLNSGNLFVAAMNLSLVNVTTPYQVNVTWSL